MPPLVSSPLDINAGIKKFHCWLNSWKRTMAQRNLFLQIEKLHQRPSPTITVKTSYQVRLFYRLNLVVEYETYNRPSLPAARTTTSTQWLYECKLDPAKSDSDAIQHDRWRWCIWNSRILQFCILPDSSIACIFHVDGPLQRRKIVTTAAHICELTF